MSRGCERSEHESVVDSGPIDDEAMECTVGLARIDD